MDVMRAMTSVSVDVDGAAQTVTEGTLMPSTHPMVLRLPGRFEPVAAWVARRYPQYAEPAEPAKPRRRHKPDPAP